MLKNDTRNQHFLPKVEQKLNALNPLAANRNLRIYSFRLIDRENYILELENPKGRSIDGNLSLFDLFSFDVLDDGDLRLNFEALFQRYETNIEDHTRRLLEKVESGVRDVKVEVIEVFAAKILNFVRNPYSIIKVLNSFTGLATYDPTDPVLLANYRRIISGRKPQQKYLCEKLGINEQQYLEWLRVLFMLLTPMRNGEPNFFEQMIKGLFENKKTWVTVVLSQYDQPGVLLSDRGYSIPVPEDDHMAFSFNLCSTAFITYMFADPRKLIEGHAHPEFIDKTVARWEARSQVEIELKSFRNEMELLKAYNQHVIYQCYERVYCAVKYGLANKV